MTAALFPEEPEMPKTRVLFVDDEANIRLTLPAILEMHGFKVTVAASVPEALAHINEEQFDVLIADLNIGQPGDGFTVVSAMRRTQPEAVTIIITGYPAFETALEAIRKQVDDYVVKPTDVGQLVRVIQDRLSERPHKHAIPLKRVWQILEENRVSVVEEWLARVEEVPQLAAIRVSREGRIDNLPLMVDELVGRMRTHPDEPTGDAIHSAIEHGALRRRQGYTLPLLMHECRILRRTIYELIQRHLLSVDISQLMSDMIQVSDTLDLAFENATAAFAARQAA